MRRIETWRAGAPGIENPSAIAFHAERGTLLVASSPAADAIGAAKRNVWELRPDGGRVVRALDVSAGTPQPSGLLYQSGKNSLFVTDDDAVALYEIDFAGKLLRTTSLLALGARDPEGVAATPAGDRVFVADGRAQQILELDSRGGLVASFSLKPHRIRDAEGIVYDPVTDHLFIVSAKAVALYELTRDGALVGAHDLAVFGAVHPRGLALAARVDRHAPHPRRLWVVDDLDTEHPDGAVFELALAQPPRDATTVVSLVGDVDGFGFRPDDLDFPAADADRDGLLEPGEQLPPMASDGDAPDHRSASDPRDTDVLRVVQQGQPLLLQHAFELRGRQPVWGRLTLVIGDARALPGFRTSVRANGHLVGEVLGSTSRRLRSGAVVATVLELPPAVLDGLAEGHLAVELVRDATAGEDDLMVDYSRLELALAP